ncbi:ABC transporter permease [Paeniglutamicibacter sp. R2-26]|uniref:ABC transporter permease n=1 Tax=Paeniglutamicibacter sp. R2-26 TaxID=3144417 RepID=UPI003EE805C0
MLPFLRFSGKRFLVAALTMLVIAVAVFASIRAVPGDFVTLLLGNQVTPEARAAAVERYGLDEPVVSQFFTWIGLALQGDLGVSMRSGAPVVQELIGRFSVTGGIALVGGVIAVVGGVVAGVFAGIRQHRRGSAPGAEFLNSLTLSLPDMLLGSLFVYGISQFVVPFTIGIWVPFGEDPVGFFLAAVPPAVAVSIVGVGFVMTSTRRAVTETLGQPYVDASLKRGATFSQVLRWHLPRNIAVPVLTSAALYSAFLLGGAVVAEQIFSLNGLGRYIVEAVAQRDYPAVQGGVLVAAAAFVVLNIIIDIVCGIIDPRVAGSGVRQA